jgi:thiol:disulfide interchange protein
MVTQIKKSFLAIFMIFCAICSAGDSFEDFKDPVQAEMIVEHKSVQPLTPFWVGVRLNLDSGWHAYWKNPGDAGMAPQIEWDLPEGYAVEEILWPSPKKFTAMDAIGFGYDEEVILLARITPPKTAHSSADIRASVNWVVCDDASCLPGSQEIEAQVSITPQSPELHPEHAPYFSQARQKLPNPVQKIEGERKNGLICFAFDKAKTLSHAAFYPEQPEWIDSSVDPVIIDQGTIVLKEIKTMEGEPLKGVLVLDDQEAYEIHVSLSPSAKPYVAMNQGKNRNSASAATPLEIDTQNTAEDAHSFKGSVLMAIGLAFLGGLILNCMPCVLPVISFKVLSFVKMAGKSRGLMFKHGLAFSFGVILSFWVLAGVLLLLQSWGESVGWGFQLQEPLFVGILAAVILVFALSLFGVFELGTGFATAAGQATISKEEGLISSFLSGVLATAVATPCTGPFLGTAIGFAVTLPTFQALMIFTSLGLGMASPYLLLGAFPELLKWMPKPGNWMIVFKEIMGFIMMATVLWLVWVFGAQTDTFALFILLVGFFFLAIGAWILGKWGTPIKSKNTRIIGYAAALLIFVLGGVTIAKASTLAPVPSPSYLNSEVALTDPAGADQWIPFSPEKLAELQAQGTPVFIDFTAKWCLICQANHAMLETESVREKFQEKKVVKMLADWTKKDPVIAEWLKKFGRNGVPLYVMFDGEQNPAILPQVLTPDLITEQLDLLP